MRSLTSSVVPTRFFLGKPEIGEELAISIEQGKTLTIKMLAVGPLNTEKGTREVFFELNGEVSPFLLCLGENRGPGSSSCIDSRRHYRRHVGRDRAHQPGKGVG